MPANNRKMEVGYLAGKYPGRIGHLYSPGGYPQRLYGDWLPYACDNGRYAAFQRHRDSVGWGEMFPSSSWMDWWNESEFMRMVEHFARQSQKPLWLVVPDVVGDAEATLKEWKRWHHRLHRYGIPLAFAAQDGITPGDIPSEADVVFIGGSTEWKWLNYDKFPRAGRRTHVGRVNGYDGLMDCHLAGVESCDGTGWFRGDQRQLQGLYWYLERTAGDHASMKLLQSV